MGTKVIHVEVTGKDGPKLQKFYSDIFGWSLDTNNPGGYGMYRQDDGLTGGIGAAQDGGAGPAIDEDVLAAFLTSRAHA